MKTSKPESMNSESVKSAPAADAELGRANSAIAIDEHDDHEHHEAPSGIARWI